MQATRSAPAGLCGALLTGAVVLTTVAPARPYSTPRLEVDEAQRVTMSGRFESLLALIEDQVDSQRLRWQAQALTVRAGAFSLSARLRWRRVR